MWSSERRIWFSSNILGFFEQRIWFSSNIYNHPMFSMMFILETKRSSYLLLSISRKTLIWDKEETLFANGVEIVLTFASSDVKKKNPLLLAVALKAEGKISWKTVWQSGHIASCCCDAREYKSWVKIFQPIFFDKRICNREKVTKE